MKPLIAALLIATLSLSGCMAQRKAQMQEKFQFEVVDTDGDGTISRSEFESWKSTLRSR